ncbi:uncharacterized FAD-linked oxidoreductase ARB_02478-like [Haliotis rufescens]|uniref:uncharacterized FAD-linked oxidoreductase ARB_02478-like n=1 Tax=Haliotis rufescens TaxID=6454 RepID=UPI00201EDF2A|nr:uncharacterized FAD-linked oxidoreductase ARB_02478-like [Haliotis rufescens]XP_048254498.1 uncharacterized FAD-linked oxidoreductase ARB_02478-like [Haliotis rufescens]XP_048254499.1 uncharacterized FAD-linked oxidoreductase ARB_02478-like [Haliotis rufescens]XP_048254500.1 uncharacterized FAD-linked oxidoreductase ARB_02478-like [Haliotis rufescens]
MATLVASLFLVCLLTGSTTAASGHTSDFCYPGMGCFPSQEEIIKVAVSLEDGFDALLWPGSPRYGNITIMKDIIYTRFPAYIYLVRSVEDVQKVMLFARKYDLRVTIQSSGHDYIGRSTGDGSIMINLSRMQRIDINLNSLLNADGTIRSESGNNWARVYEEVNKQGRVVVGGSAHTVAMGGYTLGGGHSPMSRSLGLAVDNLLEVTMVTADGSIVNASASGTVKVAPDGSVTHSADPDLFWSLRGGGGGTFGVVTSFVYKLHKPPSAFGHMTCVFRFHRENDQDKAKDLIKFYFDLAKTLPNEWGGYFLGTNDYADVTYQHVDYIVSMLHYGPSSLPSFAKIQPLVDYHPEWQSVKCFKQDFASFWDYEVTAQDALYTRAALVTSLVRAGDFDDNMAATIRDIVMVPPTNTSLGSCTNTLIGGHVSTVGDDDTSVSPNFRAALASLSCGVGWANNPTDDPENLAAADKLEKRLHRLGHGIYLNEPPAQIDNWKNDFWGHHYPRLLATKKTWDPSNFLTCLYCVGSDLGRNYGNHRGAPIIG